jgi:hypothetical protein
MPTKAIALRKIQRKQGTKVVQVVSSAPAVAATMGAKLPE